VAVEGSKRVRYARPMILRHLHRLLRSSVLALLVLGLVAMPLMHVMCEVHSIEHAMLASLDPHGVHFEGDKDDPGDHGQSGAKHTHGVDGLWNQGGGPSFAPVARVFSVALLERPHVALPPMAVSPVDPHAATSPFRPPIA
jgi:hypothetical protein